VIIQPKDDETLKKEKEERQKLREEHRLKKQKEYQKALNQNPSNLLKKKHIWNREVDRILETDLNPIESLQKDPFLQIHQKKNLRAEFGSNLNPLIFMDDDEREFLEKMNKSNQAVDYLEAQAMNLTKKKNKRKKKKGKSKKKGKYDFDEDMEGSTEITEPTFDTYQTMYYPQEEFEVEGDMLNQVFMQHIGKNKKYENHRMACERSGSSYPM
jgi:hypothetical protein